MAAILAKSTKIEVFARRSKFLKKNTRLAIALRERPNNVDPRKHDIDVLDISFHLRQGGGAILNELGQTSYSLQVLLVCPNVRSKFLSVQCK